MSRSIDYSTMSPQLRQVILDSFLRCFARPTPRDQLSCVLGLVLGLCGFDLDVDPLRLGGDGADRLLGMFDACADAVIAVLAAHDAGLLDVPGGSADGA